MIWVSIRAGGTRGSYKILGSYICKKTQCYKLHHFELLARLDLALISEELLPIIHTHLISPVAET